MTPTEITVKDDGPVAVIHIDRAEKLNALTAAFWPQLRDELARLESDGTTRAVVLTGAGDKAFSAGGDIAGFAELEGTAAKRAFQAECLRTFAALEESGLPVIAAVNGYAFGGGCELALACDLVLASDRAVFALPESADRARPRLRGAARTRRHGPALDQVDGPRGRAPRRRAGRAGRPGAARRARTRTCSTRPWRWGGGSRGRPRWRCASGSR